MEHTPSSLIFGRKRPGLPSFVHDEPTRTRLVRTRLTPNRAASGFFSRMAVVLRHCLETSARTLRQQLRGPSKLLKVSHTVTLGDRRSISILNVGPERFLIGCASSITLLARLPENDNSGPVSAPHTERRSDSEESEKR